MARGPGEATESSDPGGTGSRWRTSAQRDPTAGDAAPGVQGISAGGRIDADSGTATDRAAAAAPGPGAVHERKQHGDAELLRLHVDGDPDAFGELFTRHRDRLWAVAIRTLSDPEDAADALQDAMISAFRRAASFRGESAVTTWLHRIVVNACLDRIRRRRSRPEVAAGDERLLDMMASARTVLEPAHGSEVSMEVMAALRRLPHDQQVALVLVDMLDYPVAEAAEVLGVAEGTVKSRCARGRTRLLPRLAHLRPPTGSAVFGSAGADSAGGPRHPRSPGPPGTHGPPAVPGEVGPGELLAGGDSVGSGQPDGAPDSGQGRRNRFAPGSVLPAEDGGEEET
jgi:RNA polymerase sigma-70 factor, ECF subfamily